MEDIVYLGTKEKLDVNGNEFDIRGLTLEEGIEFSDVMGKVIARVMGMVDTEGNFNSASLGSFVPTSKNELEKLEALLCKITGKPKRFFLSQDPSFFSSVLLKVVSMTNLEKAGSDFTKMTEKMGLPPVFQGLLGSSAPTKDGE